MKKRFLSLALALGLSLAVPAAAAPSISAYDACQLLEKHSLTSKIDGAPLKGKFFIDFDKNGVPEMVAVYGTAQTNGCVLAYYVTDSGTVAQATGYSAGIGSGDGINIFTMGSKYTNGKIIQFKDGSYGLRVSDCYGGDEENTDYQYNGNGKFKKTSAKGTELWTFTVVGWKTNVQVPEKYAYFAEPTQEAAQPATPAVAAGELPGYYGDRAGCKMTAEQANAFAAVLEAQMEQTKSQCADMGFGSATCGAALVDFGNGVPALFFAGGNRSDSSAYKTANKTTPLIGLADVAQSALWLYEGGKAVRLTAVDYQSVYLYPTYIYSEYDYGEGMNNVVFQAKDGAVSSAGGTTLNSSAKRGTWLKGESLCGFAQGGGVEGDYWGLTDASQVLAGLKGYAATAPTIAAASTQTVAVDGKPVEFQMYALKDANGGLVNYVKVRDLPEGICPDQRGRRAQGPGRHHPHRRPGGRLHLLQAPGPGPGSGVQRGLERRQGRVHRD